MKLSATSCDSHSFLLCYGKDLRRHPKSKGILMFHRIWYDTDPAVFQVFVLFPTLKVLKTTRHANWHRQDPSGSGSSSCARDGAREINGL